MIRTTNPHQVVVFLLGIATASICNSNLDGQSNDALRWKFVEGDRYTVTFDQQNNSEVAMDRRTVSQKSSTQMTVDWTVNSIDDDGAANITQLITAIAVDMTVPSSEGPQQIIYDSSSEEEYSGTVKRVAKSFARIINQPINLVISPRGKITNVLIPKQTMESLRQMPGSMDGRKSLSLESVQEMFASATVELPEGAVTNGSSWTVVRDFQLGTPQKFQRTTTFTVGQQTETVTQLDFDSVVAVSASKNENENREIEFESMEVLEQSSGGQMVFNHQSGTFQQSQSQTKITTKAIYRDIEVRSTITSELKMKMEKK